MTATPDTTAESASTHQIGGFAVFIVGAGPTGLALAAQLQSFGIPFRIVDRAPDRARESRALAVQARTLELLQLVGVADALVARGNTSARLMLHFEGGAGAEVRLGGFAAADTRFPFILFVSQAETEALLGAHLTSRGVTIERGVELSDFAADAEGVDAVLRRSDGNEERVRTQYLVGCDGAHSAVRKRSGIPFEGDAYLQDFMLGDVEADARSGAVLQPDTLHSFAGRWGTAMFFPLGRPATWRVIAMSGSAARRPATTPGPREEPLAGDLSLADLQAVVDGATDGGVRLRDPVWLAHFRLHHRQAARYREGRVFLAGDAGHIHSPVGGQGMNTGIQDAFNLGWKLALAAQDQAAPGLLDTYQAERHPIARSVLRGTHLGTRLVLAQNPLMRAVRERAVPAVVNIPPVRRRILTAVSQLAINYRGSSLSVDADDRAESRGRLHRDAGGLRAGDRV